MVEISGAQLDQITETHQKLYKKNREIDWSYLCLQQFDKFLEIKMRAIAGNGNDVNLLHFTWRKIREITASQLDFVADFSNLKATV